jgi:hypothetical protein
MHRDTYQTDPITSSTRTDYSKPENLLRALKAVRAKCLDCTGGSAQEVRLCPSYHCALWPYRLGKRPSDQLYTEKPPRYAPPRHLPTLDDQGHVRAPQAAGSLRSCTVASKSGEPGGAP